MISEISVRPMRLSDAKHVYDVQCAGFGEDFLEPISMFQEILETYNEASFVATQGDKVIGYLLSQPSDEYRDDFATGVWQFTGDETCIYLHDLCIHPDFHGKGIAQNLFTIFVDKAKSLGFQKIIGIMVQNSSSFWEKMGFDIKQSYPYNGEEGFYMIKDLPENL